MNNYNIYMTELNARFKEWTNVHYLNLAIFNIIIVLLVLLRSAGYFEPFLPLSINLIVFIGFVIAIILLHFHSKSLFIAGLIFWILAGLFKLLQVDVWSERAAIYAFQVIFLGILIIIIDEVKKIRFHNIFKKIKWNFS